MAGLWHAASCPTKPSENPAEPLQIPHLEAVLKQGTQPISHRYRDGRAAGRGVWTRLPAAEA